MRNMEWNCGKVKKEEKRKRKTVKNNWKTGWCDLGVTIIQFLWRYGVLNTEALRLLRAVQKR